jgi:hypothetical protein
MELEDPSAFGRLHRIGEIDAIDQSNEPVTE